MRSFSFVPGYYEWHLVDESGKTLHNMVDPSECLYDEDGNNLTLEGVTALCEDDLNCADSHYSEGDDYNGILLDEDESLSQQEIVEAAKVMGQALYDYYLSE